MSQDPRPRLDPKEAAGPDRAAQRKLEIIRSEAQRMGRLVDELLELSRLDRQSLRIEDIDMSVLARGAFQSLAPHAGPPQPTLAMGPLPVAQGDRARLAQVWENLLSNAIKFSAGRAQPRIEVNADTDAQEHVFCVRDNGAGFDPRGAAQVFDVFQRLHSAGEFPGAGVGLALVHRIVTLHGGRVWAEGTPGEGATFCFTLPRGAGRRPVPESPAQNPAA